MRKVASLPVVGGKMLNTLHEVLIFLEDKGRASLDEFKAWPSRQVRGALGRLEREQWVHKEKREGQTFYELSARGQLEIDAALSNLKTRSQVWDGTWQIVMFDVPEKERDLRDKFRRGLSGLNLHNLQGSVWVASKDIKEQVKQLASQVGVTFDRLNIFIVRADNDRNVARSWRLDELNKEYRQFVRSVEKLMAKRHKLTSFDVKKLIFEYALIRKKDPNLPAALLPRDWAEQEAYDSYQRLRRELI